MREDRVHGFQAIDGRLSPTNQKALRATSSAAEISPSLTPSSDS